MSWIVNCPHCTKEWFIPEADIAALEACPFCEGAINRDSCTRRQVNESRLDDRAPAGGCQIYLRSTSLLDWLKKPEMHVYDVFDLSEGGAGLFLSEKQVIEPDASEGPQKVIVEGLFLDLPDEKKRVITGPIQIPAEVRWTTGSSGDGRAGLHFLDKEDADGRDTIAEILKILRERAESGDEGEPETPEGE